MRVFQRFFIKALKNQKLDINKCPFFKKITKFIFRKLCNFIFFIVFILFIILLYKIYMQIRDKPLEYVLVPPKIFDPRKNISFLKISY